MARQCRCGGVISVHELVRNREAWSCKQCGSYEARHVVTTPFSDFIRNATAEVKQEVYLDVLKRATDAQNASQRFDSVFDAIADSPEEAESMKAKADAARALRAG